MTVNHQARLRSRVEHLTVGQVARAVGVSDRTARAWADDGHLPCFRLPEREHVGVARVGDRRFLVGDVIAFLRKHAYPDYVVRRLAKTSLLATDGDLAATVMRHVPEGQAVWADSLFRLGLLAGEAPACRVVIDASRYGNLWAGLAALYFVGQKTPVLVLMPEDWDEGSGARRVVPGVPHWQGPWDPQDVAAWVKGEFDGRKKPKAGGQTGPTLAGAGVPDDAAGA